MPTARWLTPNAPEPHKQFTRRLVIPAASDFLGLVNGALFELCQVHNWEQDGTMTPQEAADWFLAWWQQYLQNENEPPAWDSPENVDGQPEQPWYEQLEDWIIQGFLAITFTPLAALVYQTTVPKIRVAIRTGNLGALFKVLINGVEVWTGDSYGPIVDIIEQVFDNPNPGTAATVHVIHDGNGGHYAGDVKLEVVRGDAVAEMVQTILRGDPGGCGVQWSLDNGGSWNTIDLAYCISTLAAGQIDQYIRDGKIAVPGGQPGPQPGPAAGTCVTHHVVLSANSQWILPAPLLFGQTVQVKNLSGAWTDGTPAWFCPDGSSFGFGTCGPGGQSHESGDLLNPGAYHMALIMKAGEDWFPAPETVFSNESGTTPIDVIFSPNDGSLSDNWGNISFDVEVCNPTDYDWTYVADFANGDEGWQSFDPPSTGFNLVTFSGGLANGGASNLGMKRQYPGGDSTTRVTYWQLTGGVLGSATWALSSSVSDVGGSTEWSDINRGTAISKSPFVPGHYFTVTAYEGSKSIATVVIKGTGTNPFIA